MRARLCIVLICLSAVLFSGCQSSRKIETAQIIENVTISEKEGQTLYTFYILSSADTPLKTEIPADSFEQACRLAQNQYIPNITLSKLELLMIEESLNDRVLKTDIEYISTQPSFSPSAFVTFCDRKTLEKFAESTREQDIIEEQLILLKKNNPAVNINYLSVFNHFETKKTSEFLVGTVSFDGELKIGEKKVIKNEK